MRRSLALVVLSVLAVSCGKKSGGDGDGEGIVVGKLAPRTLTSPDGKTTVKGSFPESWTAKDPLDPSAVRVELRDDGGIAEAHIQVGPYWTATKSAKEMASDIATSESAYGKGSVLSSGVEIAPGRYAKVAKMLGVQWKPGIDMFEVNVYWGEPPSAEKRDSFIVNCWVGWKGKTADGAADLCKDLEVTVAK